MPGTNAGVIPVAVVVRPERSALLLSTLNVALGPAADDVFPAKSEAVAAAMLTPRVPAPVMLLMVTVRVRPLPETPSVPLALPVALSVMSPMAKVLESKLASAYVTAYVTVPPAFTLLTEGAPMPMVGAVRSIV